MTIDGIKIPSIRHRAANDTVSLYKRSYNIGAFSNLDRLGLSYGTRQRKVLLHITDAGEHIFIQYPGKESARIRNDIRPWDFRPKLIFPDGKRYHDISFINVRDDLRSIMNETDPESMHILASLFCRMAYMTDHKMVIDEYRSGEVELPFERYKENSITGLCYYRFCPDPNTLGHLQKSIGNIGNISVEAYLYLNEYIAQNEDCKYHYRDIFIDDRPWGIDRGRYNMFMTYVNIIGMLLGIDGCSDCDLKRNVNPIPERLIPMVTGGLITL